MAFPLKYTRRISKSFKTRGVLPTLHLIIDDFIFQWKYGVDTGGVYELHELTIKGENAGRGIYYQGANYTYFKQCMAKVKVDFTRSGFIDFGCGKGKTLIMAAEAGFKHICGVDFARELVDTARKNIEKTRARFPASQFRVIHEDATLLQVEPIYNVFFFNNPFDESLMHKTLQNIMTSLQSHPRDAYIVYFSPRYEELITSFGFQEIFRITHRIKTEAIVYQRKQDG